MKIELTTTGGAATIRLDTLGNVSIQAMLSVQLLAPRVVLGGGSVEFKSDTGLDIKAMGTCNIEASLVRIN